MGAWNFEENDPFYHQNLHLFSLFLFFSAEKHTKRNKNDQNMIRDKFGEKKSEFWKFTPLATVALKAFLFVCVGNFQKHFVGRPTIFMVWIFDDVVLLHPY